MDYEIKIDMEPMRKEYPAAAALLDEIMEEKGANVVCAIIAATKYMVLAHIAAAEQLPERFTKAMITIDSEVLGYLTATIHESAEYIISVAEQVYELTGLNDTGHHSGSLH